MYNFIIHYTINEDLCSGDVAINYTAEANTMYDVIDLWQDIRDRAFTNRQEAVFKKLYSLEADMYFE